MRRKKNLLEKIVELERHIYHPILHKVAEKYKISKKTMVYMKEYGPHSHVIHNIVKESLIVLLLASVISSIGGFNLESIRSSLFSILPLLILFPALANMVGSFGTIVSSKFTEMLYQGKIAERWWRSKRLYKLFGLIMGIALFSSILVGILSTLIASVSGFAFSTSILFKVLIISVLSTISLVVLIFIVSIISGIIVYNRREDPNNFLIPITTSIADLGSLIIFSYFVILLF